MIKHLGSKTVGSVSLAVGLALPTLAQYLADLLSRHGELTGRLSTYANLGIALANPAAIAAQLTSALAALTSQLASIAAGALPSVTTATASVNVDIGTIGVNLSAIQALINNLNAAASAGGLHAFSVDSTAASVGAELASQVSSGMPGGGLPGARVQGVILLTESPATFEALSALLLTS